MRTKTDVATSDCFHLHDELLWLWWEKIVYSFHLAKCCSVQWWRVYGVLGEFLLCLVVHQAIVNFVQAIRSSISGFLLTFAFDNLIAEFDLTLDIDSCKLNT